MLAAIVFLLLTQHDATDAVVVNGTDMTMDQAIMAASGSSKVFSLMEDANVVRVEMDMLFKADSWESMMRENENTTRRHKRKVIRDQRFRWANAVVPYQIAAFWSNQDYQQFQEALNEYHRYTCVRFRQATGSDADYVRVVDGSGCSSYVGRQGGAQPVTLANGCRYKGVIVHELGHAVGFQHEQTRPDRDNFVQVIAGNIDSSMLFNFNKYTAAQVDTVSVPYDYLSVMHYGEYAFSRNGQRTILTTDPAFQKRIGNRGGFSFRDVKLVNAIYGCAARNKCPERQCPGEGFVGPDCACWCPSGDDAQPITQCSGQPAITTARPVATAAARCADESVTCSQWARIGYCSNADYRQYMAVNCKVSCNLCSSGQTTTTTTTTARPATLSPCSDDHYACAAWAQLGYCSDDRYRAYMSDHCANSCNRCSVEPTKATRPATQPSPTPLRTVARQTRPSTARPQQTTQRSLTSSRLPTVVEATTAKRGPCHDANSWCSAWAESGECDANPRYMLAHCSASCNSCDRVDVTAAARCQDTETHCDYWRGRGHCVSKHYEAYMQQHCPKACGVCTTVAAAASATAAMSAAVRTTPRAAPPRGQAATSTAGSVSLTTRNPQQPHRPYGGNLATPPPRGGGGGGSGGRGVQSQRVSPTERRQRQRRHATSRLAAEHNNGVKRQEG